MTLDDLKSRVWKSLGPRKWLVGRDEVNLLTQLAVENWQSDYYAAATTDAERNIVADGTLIAVKRAYQAVGNYSERQYGMIWALLLSAVASAVIQALIKWWLERNANQALMRGWQREATR